MNDNKELLGNYEDYAKTVLSEYYEHFGEPAPTLPMMISQTAHWYIEMLQLAIYSNEKLTQEFVDDYISKNNIKHDIDGDDK